MSVHRGSCHCGAVTFTVDAVLEPYTCDCSLCRRKGATMANVHESKLKILSGEDKLSLYQWNARIAKHWFCSVCGIYPFHKKRSMPDHYGVNLGCIEGFEWSTLPVRKADGVDMPIVDPDARKEWPGPRS